MGIKYSIIIPTLNEEYFLEKILLHLKSFDRDFEIIISDGGSSDNTLRIAKQHNTKIVKSEK